MSLLLILLVVASTCLETLAFFFVAMATRQIVRLRTLVLWLLHCNFLVSAEWKYGNPAKYPNAPAAGPQVRRDNFKTTDNIMLTHPPA